MAEIIFKNDRSKSSRRGGWLRKLVWLAGILVVLYARGEPELEPLG